MDKDLSCRIDIYRGFLCQYVIISHMIPSIFSGILGIPGTLAVWCFFVVSGYLNYLSFERSSSVGVYYYKRVKKLLPLLIFSFVIVSFSEGTFFVNDIYTVFPVIIKIKDSMPLNSVLWTIIIELQLYILTPLLCFVFQKNYFKNKSLFWLIVFFAVSSVLISVVSSRLIIGKMDLDDRMFFSAIPFYVFGFFLTRKNFNFTKNILKLCKISCCLLFLWVVLDRNGWIGHSLFGVGNLFVVGRFIPLLLSALVIFNFNKTSINNPILETLGKSTYEIYLFHGLCVYLMFRYFTEVGNVYYIVLFYYIFPVLIALVLFYLMFFLKKRNLKSSLYGA